MQRIVPLILLTSILAAPVCAQDAPHQYQADKPVTITAAPGAEKSAQSDPLTQVSKIALTLKFTCAQTGCTDSSLQFLVAGDDDAAATISFAADADALHGALKSDGQTQAFVQAPKPGETFDLRIYWTNSGHVTADLYRKDPETGRETMESRDVRLKGDIRSLTTRVSAGELTIVRQAYTFR